MTLAAKVALRDLLVGDGLDPHDAGRVLRFAEKLAGDRVTASTKRHGRRKVEFLRAPLHETEAEVVGWLRARGCTDIKVFSGPEGYRGSGRIEQAAETTAIAEAAGL